MRQRLNSFRLAVLDRHHYTCLVCGTGLRAVSEVAHIRSYAADPDNRANPSNGICLCKFCHSAFDAGVFVLLPDGSLETVGDVHDEVSRYHFSSVNPSTRRRYLSGVDPTFLRERAEETEKVSGS